MLDQEQTVMRAADFLTLAMQLLTLFQIIFPLLSISTNRL